MKNRSFFVAGALLLASLFTTSCKEIMSNLDEPVSSYLSAPEQVIVPMGETYDLSKVVETINKENAITYESSDPEIATVDKTTGVVTALKDGKVNVTISIKGDEYYKEGKTIVEVWSRDTDLWEPLTLEAAEDGTLGLNCWNNAQTEPVKFKVNDGDEQQVTNTSHWVLLKKGDKVQLYSKNAALSYFNIQGVKCYAYGNVMSLISPDGNWYENKEINAYTALAYLFAWSNVKKHSTRELKLPATELAPTCYYYMFAYSSLDEAPELPAEELATSCYYGMFNGCTSLTKAPALPATTLENSCYYGMFNGCTSLTKAPELLATTLANRCYSDMFAGCTSLKKAPALPATDLKSYCYNYMFGGCKELTEAPELKAATLAYGCYNSMFSGCKKLSKVTCLATTNAIDALGLWLDGAGTDASVTKRTLVRAEANTNWTNNDGWEWGTANWYVPTGWTIDPAIPE